MTTEEFSQILAMGHEQYAVEFKGPGDCSNKEFMAKVVRAVFGMANKRDGGYVIIGVNDDLTPAGLTEEQLGTWDFDDVADRIAQYADPFIQFDREIIRYDGKNFVVLHVHEFEEIPVICKKDMSPTLQRGACYVRSRGKVETRHIPSQTEMREILEIAVSKRIQQYVRVLRVSEQSEIRDSFSTDYERVISEIESAEIIQKIRSRGYWSVVIHPQQFNQELIPDIQDLVRILRTTSVDLRGWDFPHVDRTKNPLMNLHWIESETDWWNHVERWVFHQTGLFACDKAFSADWLEAVTWPGNPSWEPQTVFPVMDTIATLTEIFEFASRLLTTDAYAKVTAMQVQITAHGLRGRQLRIEDPRRHLWGKYDAHIDSFPYKHVVSRDELISNGRKMALNLADDIFKRFDCTLDSTVLQQLQDMK